MVRALVLTPLLILALLVCPLRCWGGVGGEGCSSDRTAAHCGCCGGEAGADSEDGRPEQDAPRDDCGCQNCLCDGAVVGVGEISLDLLIADVAFLDAPMSVDRSAAGAVGVFQRSDDGPPSDATGRSVRVLHQSLVI